MGCVDTFLQGAEMPILLAIRTHNPWKLVYRPFSLSPTLAVEPVGAGLTESNFDPVLCFFLNPALSQLLNKTLGITTL